MSALTWFQWLQVFAQDHGLDLQADIMDTRLTKQGLIIWARAYEAHRNGKPEAEVRALVEKALKHKHQKRKG